MTGMFNKTIQLLTGTADYRMPWLSFGSKLSRRQLIQKESEIGGSLFGPVPEGHHRQFFNLNRRTWIWYEEWADENGKQHSMTTRYEVHKNGILKVQEGTLYHFIEGQELANLVTAIQAHYERVARDVYRRDPATGQLQTV